MSSCNMGPPDFCAFAEDVRPNTWSEPPAAKFLVRGPSYLKQAGKNAVEFKQPSEESAYECINLNVFTSPEPLDHCSVKIGEFRRYLEQNKEEEEDGDGLPPHIVICFMFRSLFASEYTLVQHVFRRRRRHAGQPADPVLQRTVQRFMQAPDDRYRNDRFKFMMHMVRAPSKMTATVRGLGGERPVLIGRKLTTKYFFGTGYMEIDMDVSSSYIASALNSTINTASKNSILDYCWLIEAEAEDELPERILCKIRSHFCNPPELIIKLDANGERKQ